MLTTLDELVEWLRFADPLGMIADMSDAQQEAVARLLGELRAGSPDAFDGLLPLV